MKLAPPKSGDGETREHARHDLQRSHSRKKPSARRSRAVGSALKKEGHSAASKPALAKHARVAAKRRTAADRSASAKKAARTRAREHA